MMDAYLTSEHQRQGVVMARNLTVAEHWIKTVGVPHYRRHSSRSRSAALVQALTYTERKHETLHSWISKSPPNAWTHTFSLNTHTHTLTRDAAAVQISILFFPCSLSLLWSESHAISQPCLPEAFLSPMLHFPSTKLLLILQWNTTITFSCFHEIN